MLLPESGLFEKKRVSPGQQLEVPAPNGCEPLHLLGVSTAAQVGTAGEAMRSSLPPRASVGCVITRASDFCEPTRMYKDTNVPRGG